MLLRKNKASSVLLSLLICSVEMITPVQLGRHQAKLINVCKACEAISGFFLVALFANVKEKSSLSIVSLVLVFLLDSNKDKHYLLQQQAQLNVACP